MERDPRPVVRLARQGLPGAAIGLIAVALALLLFVILNAQRKSAAQAAARPERLQTGTFAPAPPLFVPPEPTATPLVTVVTTPALPAPLLEQPQARTRPPDPTYSPPTLIPVPPSLPPLISQPPERPVSRPVGPALVYDGGVQASSSSGTQPAEASAVGPRAAGGSDDTPARATRISNQTTTMPVGTIIPAVLETPIDTARPGLLRAVVSEDTRGFDGRRVLVQRGSRLIGEYQADVRANQNRVLVNWTRLIRPDGVAIRLGSPASDPLGGAGIPGRLHTYFFERFASAVLQSALAVGVNLASRPGNNSVIVGLPGTTVNNVVGQALPSSSSLQPKITVKQGAAVNVFVARDLDFSGVPSRP